MRGISANRIAKHMGRGRRTIDRTLTDARGVRLAVRLAADRKLYVLLPDLVRSLRSGGTVAELLPLVLPAIRCHDDGGRTFRTVVSRLRQAVASRGSA
jgi:hypothetical protein